MSNGDQVRVYPHGSPEQAATATVRIISSNQRSIAVSFEDKPEFSILRDTSFMSPYQQGVVNRVVVHSDFGVMLFASRGELNGQPWGPWVEIFDGFLVEIEEL